MASALEHLVSEVSSLISQGNFNDAAKELLKSRELLNKNHTHLDTVLATLSPAHHTIAVAHVLRARLAHATAQDPAIDTLHATVAEFVTICDLDQLYMVQDAMCETLEEYCRLLLAGECAMRGIEVTGSAILKLQACSGDANTPQHLSGAHALLLQLCLSAQCLKPALSLLDTNIMDVCQEIHGANVKHYLLFNYYGGMVYAAMKDFDRAQHYFMLCMTVPAVAVSHIMLEAYKKFIIVSILIDGKIGKLPKCTSIVVPRFIRPLCSSYFDLALAFSSSPEHLSNFINDNAPAFQRDGNLGLVNQLLICHYKKSIQKLTKTFLTLSLSDVALRVKLEQPKQAQEYLLNMIEDEEIYATINQKDGMVVFKDNPEQYNEPRTLDLLNERLENVMELEQRLVQMEESIQVSPNYVNKAGGTADDDISPQNLVPSSSM